jgi:hypothetical protein
MAKKNPNLAPWDDGEAGAWLSSFAPWQQVIRLVHGTLQLEAHKNPQEIRAAASMVIMFCRENLWPSNKEDEREKILELAARQLSTIKQLYETKARNNNKLQSNKKYRDLLASIDQEVRLLEARMSDPKPQLPNQPPCTWGEFWV